MNRLNLLSLGFILLFVTACNEPKEIKNNNENPKLSYAPISVKGQMKDVMWKGELFGKIALDTLDQKGLIGLGPLSYLQGEILVIDGQTFVSKVLTDSTLQVLQSNQITAPFFVYTNVLEYKSEKLPTTVKDIKSLEVYIDSLSKGSLRPFGFKLSGTVKSASFHIQNLPEGTKVSSPKEAHQGQANYQLANETVDIVGFFSTEHQGIFTHHDSFLHLHIITKDRSKMGHLDAVEFGNMHLMMPVK